MKLSYTGDAPTIVNSYDSLSGLALGLNGVLPLISSEFSPDSVTTLSFTLPSFVDGTDVTVKVVYRAPFDHQAVVRFIKEDLASKHDLFTRLDLSFSGDQISLTPSSTLSEVLITSAYEHIMPTSVVDDLVANFATIEDVKTHLNKMYISDGEYVTGSNNHVIEYSADYVSADGLNTTIVTFRNRVDYGSRESDHLRIRTLFLQAGGFYTEDVRLSMLPRGERLE